MKLKSILASVQTSICSVTEAKTLRQKRIFQELWTSIWLDEHYAEKENLQEIRQRYQLFDPYSSDFLLYFLWIPIGTIRLIQWSAQAGLPVFNDFETSGQWPKPQCGEWTLFTVKKKWRGFNGNLALLLMGYGYRAAKEKGLDLIVAGVDRRLFCHMRNKTKQSFSQIGTSKFYEGSVTIPCLLNMKEFEIKIKQTPLERFFL